MKEICILEDDDNIRELIQLVLESHDYVVRSYSNIKAFDQVKTSYFPDLFLLDFMLPDGNGLEVCLKLKNTDETRNIPVIIMSAHADLNKMIGADDFISKPFDIDELVGIISKQLWC